MMTMLKWNNTGLLQGKEAAGKLRGPLIIGEKIDILVKNRKENNDLRQPGCRALLCRGQTPARFAAFRRENG
jgi:hypothetical protein